jgi:hypothetical protein
MAVIHDVFTVGTSATLIAEIPTKCPPTAVLIFNDDNNPIYIGDSSITTSGSNLGLKVPKSTATTQVWLNAGDKLYAISSAGTSANAVAVLWSRVIAD